MIPPLARTISPVTAVFAAEQRNTIVGTTSVMRDDDYLIGTYRTHGHAIARGTDPKRVMAELFGRVDGTSVVLRRTVQGMSSPGGGTGETRRA